MNEHRPHPSAQSFLNESNIVDVGPPAGGEDRAAPASVPPQNPVTNPGPMVAMESLLMMLALLIGQPVNNFYAAFKTRRQASSQIKRLVDEELLTLIEVAQGRGAKLKVICLTAKAWGELAKVGIQRPAYLVQGGELHDFAARAIKAIAEGNGDTVDFEVLIESVRFDAVWRREGKPTLYINIGVSDPTREAESMSRALTSPRLTEGELIHVGISTRFNQSVKRQLKHLNPDGYDRVKQKLVGALIKTVYLKEH